MPLSHYNGTSALQFFITLRREWTRSGLYFAGLLWVQGALQGTVMAFVFALI